MRAVEDRQERTAPLALGGGDQFQINPGGLVKNQKVRNHVSVQIAQQLYRLGDISAEIINDSRRRPRAFGWEIRRMIRSNTRAICESTVTNRSQMDRRVFLVNALAQTAVARCQQDFAGLDAAELVEKRRFVGDLGTAKLAGGDVADREAVARLALADRGEKIIATAVERFIGRHRARGNYPDHFTLDHALGQGRIFHLLANCYFMAGFEEFLNIGLRRVIRYAA